MRQQTIYVAEATTDRPHRVRFVISGDGSVVIERDGVEQTHASLADARVADPDALAPLADFIDDE